ncbi:MAG: hypothetical protein ACOVMM_08780 [Chitinophagaceae bacterium]
MLAKLLSLYTQQKNTIKLMLCVGVIIQLITSYTAVGYYHPDQHFQIIEFSGHQLGVPNGTNYIWELKAQIRSTVQVYMFSGFSSICNLLSITDPFVKTTILRIITGILLWLLFNTIALIISKQLDKRSAFWLVFIVNFSWFFPYIRSLFSSEIISSLVFFATAFWYSKRQFVAATFQIIIVGFLFAIAFYLRFQFAFGLIGFGLYVLLQKQYKHILPLLVGFILGVVFNTYLDYLFYKQWVCTPYLYYTVNITQGKAAEFGQDGFTFYIGVLLTEFTILPISIYLFWHWIKQSVINFNNVFVLTVLFFVVGHSLISHKEQRFMFPAIMAMPFIVATALGKVAELYYHTKTIIKYTFRVCVWLSFILNFIILILFMFVPYAQTLNFASELNKKYKQQTITCLQRSPLETESLAKCVFYSTNLNGVSYQKISTNDSLLHQKQLPKYVATTFNQVKNDFKMLDSLGYKPVEFGNKFAWKLNQFLMSKEINTINDIWVLYQR